VTLTPSIAFSEEYNDNIFLDNQNRTWDFITKVGPAVTLVVNRPTSRLSLGYTSQAEVYAKTQALSTAFASHTFIGNGLYQATPQLSLIAWDSFTWDHNGGLIGGFATGREQSWRNIINLGLTWQMTRADSIGLNVDYDVRRFEGGGSGSGGDSDTYGFQGNYNHVFTTRLSAILEYDFTYLNLPAPDTSQTHTATLGFTYRVTPSLTAFLQGGAAYTNLSNDTTVTPAARARLTQTTSWGLMNVEYTRGVGVAGGFAGTSDVQTVSGLLAITNLMRGFVFTFNPSYGFAKSVSNTQSEQVNVKALNLPLTMAYQFNPYTTVFAEYSFFIQRTQGSSTLQFDADRNLVRVGFQFGYPFYFN